MSYKQFRQYIETIRQQFEAFKGERVAGNWEESAAAIEGLQLIYEEMQTSLEATKVIEEELFQQIQQVSAEDRHYYDLFQFLPIAYLVTDANGKILEANNAIAQLLNVSQSYLIGRPFALFVAQGERQVFYTMLNQLFLTSDVQHWQVNLSPNKGMPFIAQLKVAVSRNDSGFIESLRIGVFELRERQMVVQLAPSLKPQETSLDETKGRSLFHQSLDGLQILLVDDEADAREFITAVLESQGIRVTAVATAAEALEALERFHPNVLISDIRMPDEDGYSLIRKVRELEAQQGWHLPAVALTAYLEEDRLKALATGFESHLHKLAQPTELIEMVAQLTQRPLS